MENGVFRDEYFFIDSESSLWSGSRKLPRDSAVLAASGDVGAVFHDVSAGNGGAGAGVETISSSCVPLAAFCWLCISSLCARMLSAVRDPDRDPLRLVGADSDEERGGTTGG